MTHLLDAHTLIWSQDDPSQLGDAAASAIRDRSNVLVVGVETVWEIGIKVAIGKLTLAKPFRDWMDTAIVDFGLIVLPIHIIHIERHNALPSHHRDPFDRLLAAQSLSEGVPLISSDTIFDAYGVRRIWS